MENNGQTVVSDVPAKKVNSFSGIFRVIYQPAQFFNELKNDPKILIPYLALFVLTLLTLFLLSDLIIQMQTSSPEFIEQFPDGNVPPQVKSFMKISIPVGGAIVICLVPLLAAALALFFGNFVFGGEAKFKGLLSLFLYSEILFILTGYIMIPLMLAKGSMLVTLSPAVLVADQGLQSVAFLALSKLSVFHIWEVIVAGIGLSIFYDFPRNKGYILSVLSVGLLMILHVLTTAIGKLFA